MSALTSFELAVVTHTAKAADTLVEDALADERTEVTFAECEAMSRRVGIHVATLIKAVKLLGATVGPRESEKRVRGFTSSSNDRWFGPGSLPTHGGAGFESKLGK